MNIILSGIISFIVILLIHQLWNYLKDQFSTRKTKNLVNTQLAKYKEIIEELNHKDRTNIDLSEDLNEYIKTLTPTTI
jgi:predicted PurR-regulated permease PerM